MSGVVRVSGPSIDAHLHVGDLRHIPAHVTSARRAGVNGLWAMESDLDAYLQVAAAAAVDGQPLRLGTAVALALNRSPMVTAYAAWMLSRSTDGKFSLGLGSQVEAHNRRRFSVAADHPRDRMVEVLEAIRSIWAHWQHGQALDFRGEYYSIDLMTPAVHPGPIDHPDIPILMAAFGPRMTVAAGRWADGLVLHPLHTRGYLEEVVVPRLHEGAAQRAAPRRAVLTAQVFVATGATAQEVHESRERVRGHIAFFGSTKAYREVFEWLGWAEIADALRISARERQWSTMARLISDEILNTFAVSGAPEEIGDILESRYAGILDHAIVYDPYLPEDEPIWTRLLRGRSVHVTQ